MAGFASHQFLILVKVVLGAKPAEIVVRLERLSQWIDFDMALPTLRGDFGNAVEMIHAIAETDRARQSIIRHAFRFFLGRNEQLSDSKTLIDADRAYVESGGSVL